MPVRLGLIGYPVEHSLSPSFQQPALNAMGIDAIYELWPTPPDEVPGRVASLRAPDVLGANVTVPHKEAARGLVDEVSVQGQRAGAINTVINDAGRLRGENTDIDGLAASLRESGFRDPGFTVVVLGAGGAARGALLALEALGAARLTIANRSQEKAAALLEVAPEIAGTASGLAGAACEAALREADLLINTTSLGWKAGETPIDLTLLDLLPAGSVVFDLTYRETSLLQAAGQRGLKSVDGLAMLVYQGARSLELWTGREAPVDLMMAAAMEARSQRS
ncbi:MAG: shikimate dehydrogenase [Thermomicrobiales bacterium]|nr:shikimate dehydrogenase [Thermomicrobiales bacterium]